jgi:hypothetical protein
VAPISAQLLLEAVELTRAPTRSKATGKPSSEVSGRFHLRTHGLEGSDGLKRVEVSLADDEAIGHGIDNLDTVGVDQTRLENPSGWL